MGLGRRGNEDIDITLEWAPDMEPLRPADTPSSIPRSKLDRWTCPVCDRAMTRPKRPGRKRVYCTNSCRQYAYRWRRDHLGIDGEERPVERAVTRDLQHAVRRGDDPVGDAVDGDGRRATACGVMARCVSDEPAIHGHLRLLPDPAAGPGETSGSNTTSVAPAADSPTGRAPHEWQAPRRTCRRCVELRALPTYDSDEAWSVAAELRAEHDTERQRTAERRRRRRKRAADRAAAA